MAHWFAIYGTLTRSTWHTDSQYMAHWLAVHGTLTPVHGTLTRNTWYSTCGMAHWLALPAAFIRNTWHNSILEDEFGRKNIMHISTWIRKAYIKTVNSNSTRSSQRCILVYSWQWAERVKMYPDLLLAKRMKMYSGLLLAKRIKMYSGLFLAKRIKMYSGRFRLST